MRGGLLSFRLAPYPFPPYPFLPFSLFPFPPFPLPPSTFPVAVRLESPLMPIRLMGQRVGTAFSRIITPDNPLLFEEMEEEMKEEEGEEAEGKSLPLPDVLGERDEEGSEGSLEAFEMEEEGEEGVGDAPTQLQPCAGDLRGGDKPDKVRAPCPLTPLSWPLIASWQLSGGGSGSSCVGSGGGSDPSGY